MWAPLLEQLTPGIRNAMGRGRVRARCACGFPVPVYPGRYPRQCPECGADLPDGEEGGEDASQDAAAAS